MSRLQVKVIANSLSMFGALVALALIFATFNKHQFIDGLGSGWVTAYKESYASQARDILTELQSGRTDSAVSLLEESDWIKIQFGDRAYRDKKIVLANLCRVLQGNKEYSELLHWAAVWRGLDGRDVNAMAFWYQALYHTIDRKEEGFGGLADTRAKFPKNILAQRFYARALFDSGETVLARAIAQDFQAELIGRVTKGWGLHWKWKIRHAIFWPVRALKQHLAAGELLDAGSDLAEIWRTLLEWKNNKDLKKKGHAIVSVFPDQDDLIHIGADIPRNMSTVQINLPSFINIRISDIDLVIDGVSQDISLVTFKYVNLAPEVGSIKTDGQGDPYLVLNIHGLDKAGDSPLMTVDIIFRISLIDLLGHEEQLSYELATAKAGKEGTGQ